MQYDIFNEYKMSTRQPARIYVENYLQQTHERYSSST